MSSTLLILRNTFRLHDNLALHVALQDHECRTILIPIDKSRVLPPSRCIPTVHNDSITEPCFYTHTSSHHYAWGYHQYYLLLHVIRTFVDDIHRHYPQFDVIFAKDSVPMLMQKHVKHYAKCLYDQVDDPAWNSFDDALTTHFTETGKLHRIVTHTLLDWQVPDHSAFLHSWTPKRHNQSFKDYVFAQSFDFGRELEQSDCRSGRTKAVGGRDANKSRPPRTTRTTRTKRTVHKLGNRKKTKTKSTLSHFSKSICTEIQEWKQALIKNGVVPFEPPSNITCEQWALDQLTNRASSLASNHWEKPKTLSILSIREYGTRPQDTTSKLSPFLALGVLSAKYAYVQWQGDTTSQHKQNAKRPSSAVSQLLWREEFHACSLLDGFWHTRADDPQSRFWKRDKEWVIWKGDDVRLQPFLQARTTKPTKSTKKKMATTTPTVTTLMQDTNSSLLMLARDGWIHHLRRHTIADYLTRGYLNADWMLGESWFRQTLLDHDASVNRANWMWLSASDFSTAQLCRHYNHDDYVRRQSGIKV